MWEEVADELAVMPSPLKIGNSEGCNGRCNHENKPDKDASYDFDDLSVDTLYDSDSMSLSPSGNSLWSSTTSSSNDLNFLDIHDAISLNGKNWTMELILRMF